MNKSELFFSKLDAIASAINKKSIYKHLLFLLATIITVLTLGYYFGTFDQVSHIPFLKKNIDPSLYVGDDYFDLRFTHYSFFWYFFIPFYKLKILEITLFVFHLFSTYLTFWLIYLFSNYLFKKPLVSLLSVVVFLTPHLGFAGFPIFEFSFLNRTFVLPFILLAMLCYLREKRVAAFLLLGFLYNLHVVSVNFAIAMFLVDSTLRIKEIGLKRFMINVSVFLIAALPILIWRMTGPKESGMINYQWFSTLNNGILHNLFSLFDFNPPFFLLTFGGWLLIFLFFFVTKKATDKNTQIIKHFFLAIIIILLIHLITSYFFPVTIIVQAQIIRVGVFALFFSLLYLTNYLVSAFQEKRISVMVFFSHLVTLSVSILPLSIISILVFKNKPKIQLNIILLLFILSSLFAYWSKLWQPGIWIYPKKDDLYLAANWAKNNTPKNSYFITPPYRWWLYENDWRLLSERGTTTSLSDLLEVAFAPNKINAWEEKFKEVAPGSLEKLSGNYPANQEIVKQAFVSISTKDVQIIAKKSGAQYLLVEKNQRFNLKKVYENQKYSIYRF